MTALEDLRAVVELACLTEDRTRQEQRALLRVAVRADNQANVQVVTNRRDGPAWRLTEYVEATGEALLAAAERERVRARADRWDSR